MIPWRLGGTQGADWQELTFLSVMMDAASTAGAIQPLELDPQINIVTQLNWTPYRQPIDLDYVVGKPRAWTGIGVNQNLFEPLAELIDGDLETHFSIKDWVPKSSRRSYFITLDLGVPIPADRFVLVPAAGVNPFTQEPYRPNYTLRHYELTGSNDVAMVNRQEIQAERYYQPLDILLEKVEQNYEVVIDIDFPLQYLQFFRMHLFKDQLFRYSYFSIAELELYGRGFVPRARWVSQVIDFGQVVNIGPVHWGLSKWRQKEGGGEPVSAPEAPVRIRVEVKTGLDDTPIAYLSYNDLQQHVEVTRAEYDRLKPRSADILLLNPPSVGWRGPVIDDQNQWSFWSAPLRHSGQRPRGPRGRYLQLQIQLETDELWAYARLDSLQIEVSPILAHRVLGEVAVVGDLRPERQLAVVLAGEQTELVYDIGAEFTESGQSGFDAICFLTPAAGTFVALQMGEPLAVVAPDSVVQVESGFVVFLPQPVSQSTPGRLRVQLKTTIFGVSGQLDAEVFARNSDALPQRIEAGNVSEEIGTDQLLVVAQSRSLGSVIGSLAVHPPAFTPQGDGINDQVHINYTLFRVLEEAKVEVAIYSIGGHRVRQIGVGAKRAGHHSTTWDGRDETGQTVPPGLYLVQIEVETEKGQTAGTRPVAVVY